MLDSTINCKSCSDVVTGNFCSNCGHPVKLKRVDSHYIAHEIQHLLHFEKGFLYTTKELLVHPGKTIREFIADNRSRLVKPIVFLIVTSLIYSTITHLFHTEDKYIKYDGIVNSATSAMFAWIQGHYGYTNIIMGLFIAPWLKLFFKKSPYNFFEILILLCFGIGVAMLIIALFAVAESVVKIKLMGFGGVLAMAYVTWCIGQFFDRKKVGSYFKAFSAYMLGMICFSVAALLIGAAVDTFLAH